jgi:hypothetical protein
LPVIDLDIGVDERGLSARTSPGSEFSGMIPDEINRPALVCNL